MLVRENYPTAFFLSPLLDIGMTFVLFHFPSIYPSLSIFLTSQVVYQLRLHTPSIRMERCYQVYAHHVCVAKKREGSGSSSTGPSQDPCPSTRAESFYIYFTKHLWSFLSSVEHHLAGTSSILLTQRLTV